MAESTERVRAFRARQRELLEHDAGLELYVARELAVTRHQLAHKLIDYDGYTLPRCESYARWRWAEYRAGNVAAL